MSKFSLKELKDPYKQIFIGSIAGVASGFSALIFSYFTDFSRSFFFNFLMKSPLPLPHGEGESTFLIGQRFYLLPLVLALSGLLVGLIIHFIW